MKKPNKSYEPNFEKKKNKKHKHVCITLFKKILPVAMESMISHFKAFWVLKPGINHQLR